MVRPKPNYDAQTVRHLPPLPNFEGLKSRLQEIYGGLPGSARLEVIASRKKQPVAKPGIQWAYHESAAKLVRSPSTLAEVATSFANDVVTEANWAADELRHARHAVTPAQLMAECSSLRASVEQTCFMLKNMSNELNLVLTEAGAPDRRELIEQSGALLRACEVALSAPTAGASPKSSSAPERETAILLELMVRLGHVFRQYGLTAEPGQQRRSPLLNVLQVVCGHVGLPRSDGVLLRRWGEAHSRK